MKIDKYGLDGPIWLSIFRNKENKIYRKGTLYILLINNMTILKKIFV